MTTEDVHHIDDHRRPDKQVTIAVSAMTVAEIRNAVDSINQDATTTMAIAAIGKPVLKDAIMTDVTKTTTTNNLRLLPHSRPCLESMPQTKKRHDWTDDRTTFPPSTPPSKFLLLSAATTASTAATTTATAKPGFLDREGVNSAHCLSSQTKSQTRPSCNMTSSYLGTGDADLKLTERNFTNGRLPNGKNLLILFDSGASKSIISQQIIRSSPYLSNLQPTEVTPVQFRLGNGQLLVSKTAVKFPLNIQGHKFEIAALIVSNLVGVDLILGTNTLSDLDGALDFRSNRFRIKCKTISFAPPTKVMIAPGDSKFLTLQGRTPAHLRNSDVVLTANKYLAQYCPTTMIVSLRRGRAQVLVTNSTYKPITFSKGRPIAFLDTTKLVNVTQEIPKGYINMVLKDADNLCTSQTKETNVLKSSIRCENLKKTPS